MTLKTITIDQKSMDAASADQLDLDSIVTSLILPEPTETTRCSEFDGHGFIISSNYQWGDALLTISLLEDGPLSGISEPVREEALSRILRASNRIIMGRRRSIAPSWHPFHHDNLLTFQADRFARQQDGGRRNAGRVVIRIAGTTRIFAFHLDREGVRDISTFIPNEELAAQAEALLPNVLASVTTTGQIIGTRTFSLGQTPAIRGMDQTTDDWYTKWFTSAQKSFVDNHDEGGLRLVGPAGTGKTRTLVVKALRILLDEPSKRLDHILFLTHASRTVQDIEDMVLAMEPELGIGLLLEERPRLSVQTIYTLAQSQMGYDLKTISPISIDGHEGREYQAILLNDLIDQFLQGDWVTYRAGCSEPLREYMESSPESPRRRFFLWDVLNEFACVLDAEGVRSDPERRKSYLANNKRKAWMWHLPKREDRAVIANLYDLFRAKLRKDRIIGTDQMVTDYLRHLDSFRWEALQYDEGYDAVFVDELHLFNRQERMVFRHMLRDAEGSPRVYMAYDAKQSPRDTFMQLPGMETRELDLWKDARLGKMAKIELDEVFRYTPQIANALRAIDSQFPGQDLGDDWLPMTAVSHLADGPVPTLQVMPSTSAMYGQVFKRARQLQLEAAKGARVAVLCVSQDRFQSYLHHLQLRDSYTAITSREDAAGSLKSNRKFIFSTPEYVSGLQFDTVLLIDVNFNEMPQGAMTHNARRHFASIVYLGASRARQRLELYANAEEGGIAPILSYALSKGVIDKMESVVT
jgi:hypothetical protein